MWKCFYTALKYLLFYRHLAFCGMTAIYHLMYFSFYQIVVFIFLVGLTLYLHFFVTVRSTCTLRNHGIIIFLKRNKMNKTKQLLQISYVVLYMDNSYDLTPKMNMVRFLGNLIELEGRIMKIRTLSESASR